jgi:predicted nucleic acid-binding protein
MRFLLDTNVISEINRRARCDRAVTAWYQSLDFENLFLSVMTTGEIRRGTEKCRLKDVARARAYENWLRELESEFEDRIIPVTAEITDMWGRLTFRTPIPVIDGLLAATARYHGLTVATRNESDFQRMGVDYFNPFTGGKP